MSSGSSLLVTGGLGFIGSHFLRWWHERHTHDKLVNLDAETYAANRARVADLESSKRYRFVRGDVTDAALVRRLLADADYLVHFAAESHVDRSIADPSTFVRTNVMGTQVLLEAALGADLRRFHHVSTDEVYGSLSLAEATRFSEQSPYNPRSPYAATKAAADHLVRAYSNTYGLNATITNGSNNFGPYQHPEKFVPRLITRSLLGKSLPVYGDGKNVRDWLEVEDYCSAIEQVLLKGGAGETYCVGGGSERSNLDVARSVARLTGRDGSAIVFVPDRPGHDLRYALDTAKIRREFGWAPAQAFEPRLAATVEWYKAHRTWWEPLMGASEKAYERMGEIVPKRVVT